MGELLGAVLSGGVTGIIGTAISGVTAYFKQKAADKHELAMREMDMAEIRLEAESAERRVALQIEGQISQAEAAALSESIRSEASITEKWGGIEPTPAMAWVLLFIDFVRAMMRPGITIFCLWLSFVIWKWHGSPEIEMQIVQAVLFITVASSLWWFGTRGMGVGGPGTKGMVNTRGRKS